MLSDHDLRSMHASVTLSHKLLSKSEERALIFEKCRLQGINEPTPEEQRELNNIINKLITSNMRLVSKVATFYSQNTQQDWRDLMQEGALGLHSGVVKFDASKKTSDGKPLRLSTYVTWWIRQKIERYMHDNGRTIRLPVHFSSNTLPAIKNASEQFQKSHGRLPTDAELKKASGCTQSQLDLALRWNRGALSLNHPVDGDDSLELGDFLADEFAPDPFDLAANKKRAEIIKTVLEEALTPRERFVVVRRFGFEGNPPKTLEVVGEELDLTRERVRQIEMVAMRKLRHPRIARALKDYL